MVLKFTNEEKKSMLKHVQLVRKDKVLAEFVIRDSQIMFKQDTELKLVFKCIKMLLNSGYIYLKYQGKVFGRDANIPKLYLKNKMENIQTEKVDLTQKVNLTEKAA